MKSSKTKVRTVGIAGVTAWVATAGVLALTMVYPEAMHWRGCLVLAASLAVTLTLAWLIAWMMPAAGETWESGYRAGERAEQQRWEQDRPTIGMVLEGRTGTTSVVPIRPVRR